MTPEAEQRYFFLKYRPVKLFDPSALPQMIHGIRKCPHAREHDMLCAPQLERIVNNHRIRAAFFKRSLHGKEISHPVVYNRRVHLLLFVSVLIVVIDLCQVSSLIFYQLAVFIGEE